MAKLNINTSPAVVIKSLMGWMNAIDNKLNLIEKGLKSGKAIGSTTRKVSPKPKRSKPLARKAISRSRKKVTNVANEG